MLKAIHAMESREAASAKAESVAAELESMRLKEAAKVVREGFSETLTYCEMPREHWRRIRTNNAIERLNREIRRRTRVVGTFPDGKSALMLVAAELKYIVENEQARLAHLVQRAPLADDHARRQAALYAPGPHVAPGGVAVGRHRETSKSKVLATSMDRAETHVETRYL